MAPKWWVQFPTVLKELPLFVECQISGASHREHVVLLCELVGDQCPLPLGFLECGPDYHIAVGIWWSRIMILSLSEATILLRSLELLSWNLRHSIWMSNSSCQFVSADLKSVISAGKARGLLIKYLMSLELLSCEICDALFGYEQQTQVLNLFQLIWFLLYQLEKQEDF